MSLSAVGKRGIEGSASKLRLAAYAVRPAGFPRPTSRLEQTNVLEGACQPGAINQMRPAKHLIEKALPQLCRVNQSSAGIFARVPE